jgi:phenylalanyl-tRNA synthetase beta chain
MAEDPDHRCRSAPGLQSARWRARHARGRHLVVHFRRAWRLFGGGSRELRLANPIAADMSDMRPSLLPGLILAAQRNGDRGIGDVALFEVSGAYENDTARRPAPRGWRHSPRHRANDRFGPPLGWRGQARRRVRRQGRCDCRAGSLRCTGRPAVIRTRGAGWYHPGRSGLIKLGPKTVLGHFGEFHPKTLDTLDVSGPLCGFEVFVDAIPEAKRKATRTKPGLSLSAFQAVRRDFAFVVDSNVPAVTLVRAAQGADKQLITGVNVFDLFEGPSLGEGKKSIAIEITIQPRDRTLTDEDLDKIAKSVIANVEKSSGGVLRG